MHTSTHKETGFTLIEVAVALALMALIAVALMESLGFAQRAYQRIVLTDAAGWEVFASQRLIRNLVESAYPIQSKDSQLSGLSGTEFTFSLLASAPMAAGGAGLYRYEIGLRRRNDRESDVVVRWWTEAADMQAQGVAMAMEEILIERVLSARWSYQGPTESNYPAVGNEPSWQSTWTSSTFPVAVRLEMEFPPGDPRRWPALVMSPRLTDDANCTFDVVAQRCRKPL